MISEEILINYILLPGAIFLARITDVTLGTLRIIAISREKKLISSILGFFEVLIWIIVITQVMQNLTNIFCYIAYACGFALGNLFGIAIQQKLALGTMLVTVVTKLSAAELIEKLRSKNYGVTVVEGEGSQGLVHIIYIVIKRRHLPNALQTVLNYNPNAFYVVEEIKFVKHGVFPQPSGKYPVPLAIRK